MKRLFISAVCLFSLLISETVPADSVLHMIHVGDSLKNAANFDSALTVFHRALAIAKNSENNEHIIGINIQLSNTYVQMADHKSAEIFSMKALSLADKDGRDSIWIDVKKQIILLQYMQGKYENALTTAQEVIPRRIKLVGFRHSDVVIDYNDIGVISYRLGKYSEAVEAYSQASRIIENDDQNIELRAKLLNNIGVIYAKQGNYLNALDHYKRSLEIKKHYYGDQHRSVGTNLRNIGIVYSRIGEYNRGMEYYHLALKNWINYYGDSHPKVGELYQDISVAQMYLGNYQSALDYQKEAMIILSAKLDEAHPLIALGNSNLSMLYMSMEMYDEAEAHNVASIQKQIERFGENHLDLAVNYSNLGTVYAEMGKFQLAVEYLEKALTLRKTELGKTHYKTAIVYGKIGSTYFKSKNYSLAEKHQLKALDIAIEFWGEYHHRTGEFYTRLGQLYSVMNMYDTSLKYYQKNVICQSVDFGDTSVFANPDLIPNPQNYQLLNALSAKAKEIQKAAEFLSLSDKENFQYLNTSLETFEHSIRLLNTIRKGFYLTKSKLALSELHNRLFTPAIRLAYQLYNDTHNSDFLHKAFFLSEQEHAMVFWENLTAIDAKEFGGIPDSLLQQEKSLRTEIAFFQNNSAKIKSSSDKITNDWDTKLFHSTETYKSLLNHFETYYPDYFSLKFHTDLMSPEGIQSSLDRRTALIEYSVSDSLLYIFVLTKNDLNLKVVPIDTSFSDLLHVYRRSIITLNQPQYIKTATELYSKLIAPIHRQIRSKKKLIIIPHDKLYMIPFEPLLTKQPKKVKATTFPFFINKFDITYQYSANLYHLIKNISDGRAEKYFSGFAPANYQHTDGFTLPNLPESAGEIQEIKSLFDKKNLPSTQHIYAEATEKIIKSNTMQDYRFVHLATHGIINSENPDQSCLIFSNDDTSSIQEDNVLYANECYTLDLKSDLVVLSSCESGVGEIISSEGMMGLNRGFQYSGTKNIVYSLWKVDDASSRELMHNMYKSILRKGSRSDALRQAKLALIKNPATAFPKAWAGYIWMGE